MLHGLEVAFGLTNTALEWIRSFLTDHTQQVSYYGGLSPIQCVLFGVPQGSVLGPLVYVLYTVELELILACHGLRRRLLYGVSHGNIRQVQSVQNAAARLLTAARRREHISPVPRQLHWLPIQSRVNFKPACFVFSSLSGHAPSYLSDDIHLVSEGPRRRLRSSHRQIVCCSTDIQHIR